MAQNVYANGSAAKEIFINQSGSWTTVKGVWVKQNGVWVQCFPAASGTQSYTTAGTYSFVVPNGIYSLTSTIVGGGGGGGGFYGNGDNHAGGGGGSGGFYSGQAIAVTPGETLTVVVGAGGLAASVEFNGVFKCTGNGTTGMYYNGTAGGNTTVSRGATVLYTATGGGPGLGAGPGDNYGLSAPGAGGSPNGVAGTAGQTQRNSYPAAPGGSNGTGYGSGGNGNGQTPTPWICPGVGGTGAVVFSW